MKNYSERYNDGECENVWLEIRELGVKMIASEEIDEILSSMTYRIATNLTLIQKTLSENEFVFSDFGVPAHHISPLVLTSSNDINNAQKLTESTGKFGYLPMSFTYFFQKIKSVDFRGYFHDWTDEPILDGLFIDSVENIILWNETDKGHLSKTDENNKPYLAFSMDEWAKEGMPGNPSYGFYLESEPIIDAQVLFYHINISFVDYLRLCNKWCGLPNLEWMNQDDIPKRIKNFVTEIQTKLLPF